MGPGRYKFRDFVEEIDSRPASHRGVCQTTGFRLRQENKVIFDKIMILVLVIYYDTLSVTCMWLCWSLLCAVPG